MGYLLMARSKFMCFAEAAWDTVLWLVMNACVLRRQRGTPFVARCKSMSLRRQRGIPFVARSACMCLVGATWDTFFVARYKRMCFAEVTWDTFLWLS